MKIKERRLKQKFINKRVNAAKEGIPFKLSYQEFRLLVAEAGLFVEDLGFTGKNFVLARYKDKGPYKLGNCRFITQAENAHEHVRTEKQKVQSRRRIVVMSALNRGSFWITDGKSGIRWNKSKGAVPEGFCKGRTIPTYYNKNRREEAAKRNATKRAEFEKNANKSYLGSNNSQYGTYWITDGVTSKKWKDEFGAIPSGFTKGRRCG